jgi:hypothetical protein
MVRAFTSAPLDPGVPDRLLWRSAIPTQHATRAEIG